MSSFRSSSGGLVPPPAASMSSRSASAYSASGSASSSNDFHHSPRAGRDRSPSIGRDRSRSNSPRMNRGRSGSVSSNDGATPAEAPAVIAVGDREYRDDRWLRNGARAVISIVSARNLAAFDRSGTSDPYVVVKLEGQLAAAGGGASPMASQVPMFGPKSISKVHFRTQKVMKTLNPEWRELTVIPLFDAAEIVFECWDWDRSSKDDFMGEVRLPVKSLTRAENGSRDDWFPLRGSDMHKGGKKVAGDLHLVVRLVDFSVLPKMIRGDADDQLFVISLLQDLIRESEHKQNHAGQGTKIMPDVLPIDVLGVKKDKRTVSLITGRRLLGPPHTAMRVSPFQKKEQGGQLTLSCWILIPAVSRQTCFEIARSSTFRIAVQVRTKEDDPDLFVSCGKRMYSIRFRQTAFPDHADSGRFDRAIRPGRWSHICVMFSSEHVIAAYVDGISSTVSNNAVIIALSPTNFPSGVPVPYQSDAQTPPTPDAVTRAITPADGDVIVGANALGMFVESMWLVIGKPLKQKHVEDLLRASYPSPIIATVSANADHTHTAAALQAGGSLTKMSLSNAALDQSGGGAANVGSTRLLSLFQLRFAPLLQHRIIKYALILARDGQTSLIKDAASSVVDAIFDDMQELVTVMARHSVSMGARPYCISGGEAILPMLVPWQLAPLLLLLRRSADVRDMETLIDLTFATVKYVDPIDAAWAIEDISDLNFIHRANPKAAAATISFLGLFHRRELIPAMLQLLNHPSAIVAAHASSALATFDAPRDRDEIQSSLTLPMVLSLVRGDDESNVHDDAALNVLRSTGCWLVRPTIIATTVERDLIRLLEERLFPDVLFLCKKRVPRKAGDGEPKQPEFEKFPAHRAICASRCDALARRLGVLAPSEGLTPFASTAADIDKLASVELDANPRAFQLLLTYLYSDQIMDPKEPSSTSDLEVKHQWLMDVYGLLVLADDWDLDRLRALCLDKILRLITVENVLLALRYLGDTPYDDVRDHIVSVLLNNQQAQVTISPELIRLFGDVPDIEPSNSPTKLISSPLLAKVPANALATAILGYPNIPTIDVRIAPSQFLDDFQYLWDHRDDAKDALTSNSSSLADCRLILASAPSQSFNCHRCILVARCGFFEAAFRASMLESQTGTVILRNLTRPAALGWLLNFVYNGVLGDGDREDMVDDFRGTFELITELEFFQVRNVTALYNTCKEAIQERLSRIGTVSYDVDPAGGSTSWVFDTVASPSVLRFTGNNSCTRPVTITDVQSKAATGNNPVAVCLGTITREKYEMAVRVDKVGSAWIGICVIGSGVKLVDGAVVGTQDGVFNASYFTQKDTGKLILDKKVSVGFEGVRDGDSVSVRCIFDSNLILFYKGDKQIGVLKCEKLIPGTLRFAVNFGPEAAVTLA